VPEHVSFGSLAIVILGIIIGPSLAPEPPDATTPE